MSPQDMPYADADIKHSSTSSRRMFWSPLYHDVFDHEVVGPNVKTPAADDPKRTAWQPFAAWFWMLSETAHRSRSRVIKGRTIHLERGQIAVSERYLATKVNWSRKAVRSFLERLERFDMVTLSSATRDGQLILDFARQKKGPARGPVVTVVTICNYDKYQFVAMQKGPSAGPSKGPAGAQNLTSNTPTSNTRSHQSPIGTTIKEDQSSNFGTDGTDEGSNIIPLRPGMVVDQVGASFTIPEKTRQKIEAIGVDPDEMLDRMYEQIDKGRRVGSKSRYLITSAINKVHERDNTPIEVLKDIISGNKFTRSDAIVQAATGKSEKVSARKLLGARTTAAQTNGAALLAGLKR